MSENALPGRLADAIAAFEQSRGSRIFCILHTGDDGFCGETSLAVMRARQAFSGIDNLEILLHSPGGDPGIAFQLARFFRARCRRLGILVPLFAKSSATLLSLAADTIHIGEFGELGPLDMQVNDVMDKGTDWFSPLDEWKSMTCLAEYADATIRDLTDSAVSKYSLGLRDAFHESAGCVAAMVRPLFEKVDTVALGAHYRSLSVGEEYARRLLAASQNERAAEVVERLVWSYPSHDFRVDYDEAAAIGLPAERLDPEADCILTDLLLDLIENDLSFVGFAADACACAAAPARPQSARRPAHARRFRPRVARGGRREPKNSASAVPDESPSVTS